VSLKWIIVSSWRKGVVGYLFDPYFFIRQTAQSGRTGCYLAADQYFPAVNPAILCVGLEEVDAGGQVLDIKYLH
jgi:hypothetical protein